MKEQEVKSVLKEIFEEFLNAVEDNLDENGVVDFGDGTTYKTKEELIEDFVLFVKEAYLEN